MYEAQDNECTALNTCRNCMPGEGCFALKNGSYPALYVEQFGPVSTDDAIMKVPDRPLSALLRGPPASHSFLRRSLPADQSAAASTPILSRTGTAPAS
jgi:hypothetical protein